MSADKQFGVFFKKCRKSLGLTLRDFCRRNGFDPGNVSRMERGLAAPPQAQRTLESYAKSLKLKRGTDPWDRFFALAAAATGASPRSFCKTRGRPIGCLTCSNDSAVGRDIATGSRPGISNPGQGRHLPVRYSPS